MHPNSPRPGFPHLDLPSPSHPGPAWNKKASPVVDKSKWVTIGLSLRVLPSRRPFSARQKCLFSCATKRRGRWSVSCTGSQERVSRRIATVLSRRELPVRIPPFVAVKERGIPAASRALDRKNERRIPELDKEAAVQETPSTFYSCINERNMIGTTVQNRYYVNASSRFTFDIWYTI